MTKWFQHYCWRGEKKSLQHALGCDWQEPMFKMCNVLIIALFSIAGKLEYAPNLLTSKANIETSVQHPQPNL